MSPQDPIAVHIGFVIQPFGGKPDVRQREASIQYLLAHASEAYPRLLAILEAGPTSLIAPRVIEVMPRFNRPDSIALLESILLRGVELVSESAGQALGRIDHAAAAEALRKGLRSTSPLVINAAADGWMLKDSKAPCLDLAALLTHSDPNVRYHVIRSAAKLGCLGANDLERLESEDTDPDVRALARQLLLNRR